MDEQKHDAYYQPNDRERVEDALKDEFQWSALKAGFLHVYS
jgi:hypothetical protein